MNSHLMEQAASTQRETQHAHAALAEATSEAERAAVMHAEECKRLTVQLADRMRKEQDDFGGDDKWQDKQTKRLLAELQAMQVNAHLEGLSHTQSVPTPLPVCVHSPCH